MSQKPFPQTVPGEGGNAQKESNECIEVTNMNKTKNERTAKERDAREAVRAIDNFRIVGIEYGDNDLTLDRIALSSIAKALVVIRGKLEEKDDASEDGKTTLPNKKQGGEDV